MISFAFLDEQGYPLSGGTHRQVPDGAVELPEPYTLGDLSRLRWQDGTWTLRDDLPAPEVRQPTAEEQALWRAVMLDRAREAAVARINAQVGDLRKRIYTDIPGQDALYLEKRAEAVAYIRQVESAGEPKDLRDFPLIRNEVGITAADAWQLAQIWLHKSDDFKAVGAETERLRMVANIAIATAPDAEAIAKIEAEFTQGLYGLTI